MRKPVYAICEPRSLISAFVFRCLDNIIPLLAIAKISRRQLVSVTEQAGLSLTLSQNPKTAFLMTWLILYQGNNGIIEPRHEKTCFLPYANNKGADQPAHPLASLCSLAGWFESYLVENPEDRFSRGEAQLLLSSPSWPHNNGTYLCTNLLERWSDCNLVSKHFRIQLK